MLRKSFVTLLVMLMVPAIANAYNCWSITRTASPSSAASNLALVAGTPASVIVSGNTIYVTAATSTACSTTPTSVGFTVTPPAGMSTSSVKVDSLAQPLGAGYTVNKGTMINHSISAAFNTINYLVSTSVASGGGTISPSVNVASGGSTTVSATPFSGYVLTSLTDNGGANLISSPVTSQYGYTLSSVSGTHTIVATFMQQASAKAVIYGATQTTTPNTTVTVDASGSTVTGFTPTYAWSVSPSGPMLAPNGKTATLSASAPGGPYTVTFAIMNGTTTVSSATQSITVQSKVVAEVATCATCHSGEAAYNGYVASAHYTQTTSTDTSCSSCHNPAGTLSHHYDPAPTAAVCENCHSAKLSTTTHPVDLTASKCLTCHDPHNPAQGIADLAPSAHPAVTLYTFEEIGMQMAGGQKVPVQVDANGKGMPYSPKQTCGTAGCHVINGVDYTYDKISDHAFHSSQGRSEYQDSSDGKFSALKNKPWLQSTAMVGKW